VDVVKGKKARKQSPKQTVVQTIGLPAIDLGSVAKGGLLGAGVGAAVGGLSLLTKFKLPILGGVTGIGGLLRFGAVGAGVGIAATVLPKVWPQLDQYPAIKSALTGAAIGGAAGAFLPIPLIGPISGALIGGVIGLAAHHLGNSNNQNRWGNGYGRGYQYGQQYGHPHGYGCGQAQAGFGCMRPPVGPWGPGPMPMPYGGMPPFAGGMPNPMGPPPNVPAGQFPPQQGALPLAPARRAPIGTARRVATAGKRKVKSAKTFKTFRTAIPQRRLAPPLQQPGVVGPNVPLNPGAMPQQPLGMNPYAANPYASNPYGGMPYGMGAPMGLPYATHPWVANPYAMHQTLPLAAPPTGVTPPTPDVTGGDTAPAAPPVDATVPATPPAPPAMGTPPAVDAPPAVA
jgi:hypothetical protein